MVATLLKLYEWILVASGKIFREQHLQSFKVLYGKQFVRKWITEKLSSITLNVVLVNIKDMHGCEDVERSNKSVS